MLVSVLKDLKNEAKQYFRFWIIPEASAFCVKINEYWCQFRHGRKQKKYLYFFRLNPFLKRIYKI